MANQRHYLKYRDTRPTLEVILLDPDGTVHDLSGADSVKLHIWLENGTKLAERDMTINADPTTGKVTYIWQSTDWTSFLVVGDHRMEYEVIGPTTARLTFPNDGYDTLVVKDDVGQGS